MENKNNIDWNVNLNYITKDDLKTIYDFIPDADQTTIDNTKTDFTIMAIAISSERINSITGNLIEQTGFNNLNETQQLLVKRATARMTIYYLTDGMAFIRSSVSISGNGLSSSISPPSEPDYVLMEVYNLLQQANLYTPRKALNNIINCNNNDFNTPSIWDESDNRVITWDSGNKTFLQKIGIIADKGIKINDVSDTIPKIKISTTSEAIIPNYDSPNKTIDITYDKEKDIVNIDINNKIIENRIFNNKDDKDNTTRLVNEIIKTNVGGKTLIYRNNPNVTDDKDIPDKKYVDNEIIKIKDLIKKLVVWKTIGERIDDRTWSNFSPSLNALYRVFLISETSVPLQNGYKEVIFFTSAQAIGTGTRRITTRKIGNSDANLNMIYDNTKWTLKLDGGDTGGAIYRLEELKADDLYEIKSNTLDIKVPEIVDIEKPIKIDSKTLLTKEIRENEWEINLKESPTPTPYPKWKDVAISLSGNSISSYQLKSNTFYKIFYDLNPFSTSTFGKTPTQTIEIFWQPQTSSNWVCFLPSLKRISYINIVNNKLIRLITDQGYLWKLQELQE
ncbi:hypothetical protein [Spiroplasma endosymbiont of Polydrusus pterygomalis]|uniref:hypothetical protein n=1 Tax=Spiroplasma endosymbiont of Polydrusus pterygomalis TaxID=3139327 RepID=UPI003CCA91D0